MSILADLREKRGFVDLDETPEQPPKYRLKIDDQQQPSDVKVQSDGAKNNVYGYCAICKGKDVTHWFLDCPQKEQGLGKFCRLCIGPCKENEQGEHKKHISVTIKECTICGSVGNHWAEECGFRNPTPRVRNEELDELDFFWDEDDVQPVHEPNKLLE